MPQKKTLYLTNVDLTSYFINSPRWALTFKVISPQDFKYVLEKGLTRPFRANNGIFKTDLGERNNKKTLTPLNDNEFAISIHHSFDVSSIFDALESAGFAVLSLFDLDACKDALDNASKLLDPAGKHDIVLERAIRLKDRYPRIVRDGISNIKQAIESKNSTINHSNLTVSLMSAPAKTWDSIEDSFEDDGWVLVPKMSAQSMN